MVVCVNIHSFYTSSSNPASRMDFQSKLSRPTYTFSIFFFLSTLCLLSLFFLLFSIHRRHKNTERPSPSSTIKLPDPVDANERAPESDLTQLTRSLLLEILPSNALKSGAALFNCEDCDEPVRNGSGWDVAEAVGEDSGKKEKKRKKRSKKKRALSPNSNERCGERKCAGKEGSGIKEKQELVCLYPFTSSASATQRKIKQQYNQLVKSHESNGLTLAQVSQFVNCLIEARNELQHKSEVIKRKFTITKALLFKADRSSFDRYRQQIYKLEVEQKRLEDDTFVYNWLQQQLKLSPAYRQMVEIGVSMELKARSSDQQSSDVDFCDVSFEELLAQEKKDAFWQRNGRSKSYLG